MNFHAHNNVFFFNDNEIRYSTMISYKNHLNNTINRKSLEIFFNNPPEVRSRAISWVPGDTGLFRLVEPASLPAKHFRPLKVHRDFFRPSGRSVFAHHRSAPATAELMVVHFLNTNRTGHGRRRRFPRGSARFFSE